MNINCTRRVKNSSSMLPYPRQVWLLFEQPRLFTSSYCTNLKSLAPWDLPCVVSRGKLTFLGTPLPCPINWNSALKLSYLTLRIIAFFLTLHTFCRKIEFNSIVTFQLIPKYLCLWLLGDQGLLVAVSIKNCSISCAEIQHFNKITLHEIV